MIDKIPPALLVRRIGGHLTPAIFRKENFLKFALPFLKDLIREIGKDAGVGEFKEDRNDPFHSGCASFKSSALSIELSEDSIKQDGVRLTFCVKNPDGPTIESGWVPLMTLQKNNELAVFLFRLKKLLSQAKAQIH